MSAAECPVPWSHIQLVQPSLRRRSGKSPLQVYQNLYGIFLQAKELKTYVKAIKTQHRHVN